MNFPNVLKFPKVYIRELARALSVIAQLNYLVYLSFLFHVSLANNLHQKDLLLLF